MKKQVIIFVLLVLALLTFNNFLTGEFEKTSALIDTQELVNEKNVESQKLFENAWKTVKHNYYDSKMNEQDWDRWKEHYKGQIKTDEDANIAINSMLASLDDPYSRFLNKKEYEDQNTSIESKITGIGVNITSDSGKITVINVIEGTPADKAGLEPKDIIMTVDGKDVKGMAISDVAQIVRGPIESTVNLTILRGKEKIEKSIVRQIIKIETVKCKVEDNNIGYIQILSFIGANTPTEFVRALEKTEKTDGLIIDLRGNTGGLLPNAVFIANLFIPKGNIVSIVGRNGYKKNIYAQDAGYQIKKPTLILIDGASASASEILSGALKDYDKATLIGTKTFGKGMVQKIIPMENSTGLNLTIAKYLTPSGSDINKKGIEPDVKVEFEEQDLVDKNDVQLKEAKKLMGQMISVNEHKDQAAKLNK